LAIVLGRDCQLIVVIPVFSGHHFQHVVGGIVILGTLKALFREIVHCIVGFAGVHAATVNHQINVIEHLIERSAGLMNGADDRSTASRKILQRADALRGR